jgi:FixJ family two-component response regulator
MLAIWKSIEFFFSAMVSRVWRRVRPTGRRQKGRLSRVRRVTIVALVVGDEDRKSLTNICQGHQWDVHLADTCEQALEAANRLKAPVILCDRDLPGAEWRDVVQALSSSPHSACVILISRVLDGYLWKEVGRKGGYDVVPKPLQEDNVVRAVKLAWAYWNNTTRLGP